jgi:FkbM family methyltransferase
MSALNIASFLKKKLANTIRWYCINTPISKGKYRLQLICMRYFNFPERIPYEYLGIKYEIDINTQVGSRLFYLGEYEQDNIENCLRLLKPGSVFFDIGANIGIYTLSAANKGAKVFAFEPHPRAFCDLKSNMQLNTALDNTEIKIFNCACSQIDGEVSFTAAVDSAYSSLHAKAYNWNSWQFRKEDQVTVTSKTVDTLMAEVNLETVDLCKIDVEGGELNVLLGMQKTLAKQRIKALQLEINLDTCHGSGYQRQDVIDLLSKYNYFMDTKSEELFNNTDYGNFFFFPKK